MSNKKEMCAFFKKKTWKIQAQSDLPYSSTPKEVIKFIFKFLKSNRLIKRGQNFIDLGSGDGRVVIHASKYYHLNSTGIEINLELIKSSNKKIKSLNLEENCMIKEDDLYNLNLLPYDVIWTYFFPPNHKYIKHLIETIKTEAIVISIRWDLDNFGKKWKKKYHVETNNMVYKAFVYIKK